MPWTLVFRTLDERINARAEIPNLSRDEYVRAVHWVQDRDLGLRVDVEFHEGYDTTRDRELAARLEPYLPETRVEGDLRTPRHLGMTENFIRNYGSDEQRRNLDQPNIDQETRSRIIEQYIATTSGRQQLARAMVAPLRRNLDYQSVARRAFLVDELPQGALPVYDRDPAVAPMMVETSMSGQEMRILSEFSTPGHDTDYLALPGHLPLHSTKHYRDSDELPSWLAVGSWVHEQKPNGRIGMVVNHYTMKDRGQRAHLHILLGIWRTPDSVDLCANHIVVGWESCRQPPEPLTVWERILLPDEND